MRKGRRATDRQGTSGSRFFTCLLVLICSLLAIPAIASVPPNALRGPIVHPLSIDQAMDETLLKSPRAASLRMQLGIAKSGLIRATEMPNPSIFMDNGYRAEFTYRYGVTVPIEPPWKIALRILAAKKQIRLADLEIAKGL